MDDAEVPGLIIGGTPVFCRGLRAMIEELPLWKVVGEATDARRARELCERLRPAFLVIDLELTDGDGLECVCDCAQLHPAARILVVSDKEEQQWLQRAFQAGARGYVAKRDADRDLEAAMSTLMLTPHPFLGPRLSETVLLEWMGANGLRTGSSMDALSTRQIEIFGLLGEGLGVTETARRLRLSPKTVESHHSQIKIKLGVKTTTDLRRRAAGWVLSGRTLAGLLVCRLALGTGEFFAGADWAG